MQNAGLGSPLEAMDHSQPPANERIDEAAASLGVNCKAHAPVRPRHCVGSPWRRSKTLDA